MEIVGTVPENEAPQARSKNGPWREFSQKAIDAYKQGEVLVVRCVSRAEYNKLGNNISYPLKTLGYQRTFSSIEQADGSILAYLRLKEIAPEPTSVVVQPIGRRRRKVQ